MGRPGNQGRPLQPWRPRKNLGSHREALDDADAVVWATRTFTIVKELREARLRTRQRELVQRLLHQQLHAGRAGTMSSAGTHGTARHPTPADGTQMIRESLLLRGMVSELEEAT